jgi:hypothetical protein
MRSTKYLNAREYAERLYLSDNRDVQDFAREFIEALDFQADDEIDEIRKSLDEATKGKEKDAGKTYVEKAEWLAIEARTLANVEGIIGDLCPEYIGMDIEEAIAAMVTRLRPVQEYDL